jgi:hypothetical protein
LPPGLSMNAGSIDGAPTGPGNFSVVVMVSSSHGGLLGGRSFVLRVSRN